MSKERYWEMLFKHYEVGGYSIPLSGASVETLYQAFKARLMDELSADLAASDALEEFLRKDGHD